MKGSCYPSSYKAYQYELADVYYSPGICPQSTTLPLGTGLPTILNANSILVAWQESDISLFSPSSEARAVLESAGVSIPPDFVSPRTNTDKSASSTSKTQIAPTTKTDGGDPGNAGGGLSTGAAAGIGVTVGLIGVMATVAMWWYIKRYRAKRSGSNVEESRQPWLQQMYKVTDTTTRLDEGVETPRTGLRG
ncbi:hypothetical protein HYE67_008050 [Fusarium culmorum]|uniref:Uncharacterized protein n=1 Tax=Fusarium culmorum TaxID=5516 RepID=A0A2T4HAP0_FUSCU|nr:hypothetical protein FCULG_00002725 [Fusarium culmorum]QPC65819.1 hypothetical protein HYE67_008050 [Fusarium culmorum]